MNIENQMDKNESGNRKIQKLILILIFLLIILSSFYPKLTSISLILLGLMLILASWKWKEKYRKYFLIEMILSLITIVFAILKLLNITPWG
ncbi:hypothetical protein [Psychrobacillus sp. L3]|uniref:hypothetical protein n=1 Tax=Psychrobacillus sp. L3 TaxID=3236891 RepID=UPI0036F2585A